MSELKLKHSHSKTFDIILKIILKKILGNIKVEKMLRYLISCNL